MPRSCPHPLALFSLRPVLENERAKKAVSHPDNDHLISTLSDGTLALDIGFHIRGKSSKALAVIGRGVDANIYVGGRSIAKNSVSRLLSKQKPFLDFYLERGADGRVIS